MGNGNTKFVIGLIVGAALYGMMCYVAGTCKGKKLKHDLSSSVHEIEDDMASIMESAKEKAVDAGSRMADKVLEKAQDAKEILIDAKKNK